MKLRLGLLLWPASDLRDAGVGAAVENVLPVEGTLPEHGPTLGVVFIHVLRVDWSSGDVVLKSSKVGEDLGDSRLSVFVYLKRYQRLPGVLRKLAPGWLSSHWAPAVNSTTYIRPFYLWFKLVLS